MNKGMAIVTMGEKGLVCCAGRLVYVHAFEVEAGRYYGRRRRIRRRVHLCYAGREYAGRQPRIRLRRRSI